MQRSYRYLDVVTGVFVSVLLLSNLLSSAKIIDMGVSLGSFPLIFDAGTLVFPVSYIFGDILTEVYGYRAARKVIWMGFFASALMAGLIWLAGILPGEAIWQTMAGQEAYDAILGGVTGLVVASLAAYLVGEFANSTILAKMKIWTKGKHLWTRTITSTVVGQGLDSLVFVVIAFGGLASMADIEALLRSENAGLEGAITGRALYDGRIDPVKALALIAAAGRSTC